MTARPSESALPSLAQSRCWRRRAFLEGIGAAAGGLLLSAIHGCARPSANTAGAGELSGKRIGIASPHRVEILNDLYAEMRREAQRSAPGVEIVVVDGENDPMKQLQDIEAFIAQGYDAVFFLAPPSIGLDEIVARAVAAGVVMVSHGASPATGATQNIILDQHESGRQVGLFAARWINEKRGGAGEVGVLGNSADPLLEVRAQGMKDGLAEGCPGAKVVAEVHGHSIELGSSGAANMLQAHPRLCALLAHADDPGFGCYTAANEAGRTNPDEFLVASCDGTAMVLDKIAAGGVYQATWSYLFPYSAAAAMRDILRALRGETIQPTRKQIGRLVTRENIAAIRRMCADPQAADHQKYFHDPTVMIYSDSPLASPAA
ncbi:MAG: sugar ABC transporter substrate-binding protein [Pirellulales bacterium]|nr:sugar ABC transporter substrate-binding protein [Pirellulales bacterium]